MTLQAFHGRCPHCGQDSGFVDGMFSDACLSIAEHSREQQTPMSESALSKLNYEERCALGF